MADITVGSRWVGRSIGGTAEVVQVMQTRIVYRDLAGALLGATREKFLELYEREEDYIQAARMEGGE